MLKEIFGGKFMEIIKALPMSRYAKAAAHSKSPEFKELVLSTISMLKEWRGNEHINQEIDPCLWFSHGKDGMATFLLLKMAGIEFTALSIRNGGDVAGHELIYSDFNKYIGSYDEVIYETEHRLIDYIREGLEWGRSQKMTKKDKKTPIDFFDWGEMATIVYYHGAGKFHFRYGNGAGNILNMWGTRAAEGMERYYEIKNNGLLSHWDEDSKNSIPMSQGLPIGLWKDIDVWALLVQENCPVSPIYGMNAIAQKKGKGHSLEL